MVLVSEDFGPVIRNMSASAMAGNLFTTAHESKTHVGDIFANENRNEIRTKTRLPSNLRPTTGECVHLATGGHFRSRDKHDSHTVRSAVSESPMLHTDFTALCDRSGIISERNFTLQE